MVYSISDDAVILLFAENGDDQGSRLTPYVSRSENRVHFIEQPGISNKNEFPGLVVEAGGGQLGMSG
jgi:hypothetical protein